MLRAFVVDDEPLAVRRLAGLLHRTGRVDVVGSSSDPIEAVSLIDSTSPDVLFLDIQMPEANGFELLARLGSEPLVVFTTAFDQYALQAFEVNSIDYLLKPVEEQKLQRALTKLERMRGGSEPKPEMQSLLRQLAYAMRPVASSPYPDRISSRVGDRILFVDLDRVTHFFAEDKLTYAATPEKSCIVDSTIAELEQKLDPKKFLRIHRATLVNIAYVHELHTWFGGRMLLRLKDGKRTELTVARDRVKELKDRLGI